MENNKYLITDISLLLATFMAIVVGAFLSDLPENYRLNQYGIETRGTVVSKDEKNHRYIEVKFKANYQDFTAGGRAEHFGKTFFTVKLGEEVPVFYNPEFAEESCLGNPNQHFNSSLVATCFVTTFPAFFFIVSVVRRKNKKCVA